MHALSLPTWWIHLASVLEWMLAIPLVQRYGLLRREGGWRWLALAMVPALASGTAVCTWHLHNNAAELQLLSLLQAALTLLGNTAMACAAWNLMRQQRLARP
jgi:hypothetical protein